MNDDEKWLIDTTSSKYRLVRPSDLNIEGNSMANELYLLNKIEKTIDEESSIFNSDGFVDHCENYTELRNNQYGCNKCDFGYFGQIVHQEIKHCHEYDGFDCIKCI